MKRNICFWEVKCLDNFVQESKSKSSVNSHLFHISYIWFHYKLNGLHLTPSSSVGEVTSCELYDQTVFRSRARDYILSRVPLAVCLVHVIPLYVIVKLADNKDGHWCPVPASIWKYICCVSDLLPCVHAGADMIPVLPLLQAVPHCRHLAIIC